MPQPRMRPEFSRPLGMPPAAFYAALEGALADSANSCRGQTFASGAILRLRDDEQRVWSPALHLRVVDAADGSWELRGRFTPSSPVWTAFLAIYLVLALGDMHGGLTSPTGAGLPLLAMLLTLLALPLLLLPHLGGASHLFDHWLRDPFLRSRGTHPPSWPRRHLMLSVLHH